MERYKINIPIVVEGKYDKIKLSSFICANIIALDGFAVFNSRTKQQLIRRIAEGGIILLTDPDGAGKQIRAFLTGILPKDKIFQAYIPKIEGKEKRKSKPSKAGYLGVEGVDKTLILNALRPFVVSENSDTDNGNTDKIYGGITKLDFYNSGLSGAKDSKIRRAAVAKALDLPTDLSSNALLDAINTVCTREEFFSCIESNII